ncbi:MAG: LysM peptidoglycan-binding domain-containing protein [Bacteroidales bacterium]|nr:LysM peptidoglycan-binding domain-containing protein [Bacteroidales bacterium]
MIKRIIILFCLFFAVLGSSVIYGQVVVERSNEKTIISGKQYYLHTVKKEETTYSISKANNVSVEDIT